MLGLTAMLGLPAATPAAVFGTQSVETDLNFDDCTITKTNDFTTVRACPGYKGIPVMIADDNARLAVSYGLRSTEEKAAGQMVLHASGLGPSIEWRLSNRGGAWTPFATILRFKLDAHDGLPAAEVLVVTRLVAGETCQIAYVDATANPDAPALAERTADESAPDFDCNKEPVKVGAFRAW
ncbi:MAG: hypothetical protein P4M09_28455 [Devosia sp.]|nr:hypothetical protein [Devosia sp.]